LPDVIWRQVQIPENSELTRKEWFDYANEKGSFLIELFENMKGEFYAIGTPKDPDKLIVYGSPIMTDKVMALQTVIEKIEREQ
jgi:hypothetical protein